VGLKILPEEVGDMGVILKAGVSDWQRPRFCHGDRELNHSLPILPTSIINLVMAGRKCKLHWKNH
jgi:hypothetical protein